jgi:CubicO group peptidase (beta-lactamase class C family)
MKTVRGRPAREAVGTLCAGGISDSVKRGYERVCLSKLRNLLTVFAVGLAALATPALSQPLNAATQRAIDAAMQASITSGWTAGGAVAVMRHGKVVFARGYGMANLETGTPATPDSVFRIGSLTKQFTAAAILSLVDDGKLSLEDKVRKYVPELPADDATTIRQLLTHTAGFTDYVGGPNFDEREKWLPLTTDQLLAYVLSAKPLHRFEPGTQWDYSSANYAFAGAIVERVSGQPLRTFVKTRLLDPLGMSHTAFDDERALVPGRASGYDRLKVETSGYINTRTVSMSVPFAAGAMRSTVTDLLIWSDALHHGRVLKPDSYRQMTTPARMNDGTQASMLKPDGTRQVIGYGMGLSVSGDPAAPELAHDGAIDGFTSMMTTLTGPDVVLAVLVNTSPSEHLPFDGVISAVKAEVIPPKATN